MLKTAGLVPRRLFWYSVCVPRGTLLEIVVMAAKKVDPAVLSALEAIFMATSNRLDGQKELVQETDAALKAARDHNLSLAVVKRLKSQLDRQTKSAAITQSEALELKAKIDELRGQLELEARSGR